MDITNPASPISPFNPASPLNPLNPLNPASPLNIGNSSSTEAPACVPSADNNQCQMTGVEIAMLLMFLAAILAPPLWLLWKVLTER